MESMRPSILRRPIRATSCTKETSEEQYQREQDLIAARAQRMIATEHRLMSTLYPTPEVQQQRQQELEQVRQQQLAAQAAERRAEAQTASAFTDSRPTTAPPTARPWEGSALSYASRSDEERARKALAAQTAEANRMAATAKALERQQQKQDEAAAVREQLQPGAGCNFWNLGAVPGTGRFIAPDQRWMHSGDGNNYRAMLSRPESPRAAANPIHGTGYAFTPAPAYNPITGAYSNDVSSVYNTSTGYAPQAAPAVGSNVPYSACVYGQEGARYPGALYAPPLELEGDAAATAAAGGGGYGYAGLKTPYATHAPSIGGIAPSAAAAAAGEVREQPAPLQAPWATYTPAATIAATAAAAAASRVTSIDMGLRASDSAAGSNIGFANPSPRYVGNRNSSSQMARVLGVGGEGGSLQQSRPVTAAAAVGGGARRFPWEWPGA